MFIPKSVFITRQFSLDFLILKRSLSGETNYDAAHYVLFFTTPSHHLYGAKWRQIRRS